MLRVLIFFCNLLLVLSPCYAQQWPDRRQAGRFLLFANFSLENDRQLVDEMGSLQQDLTNAIRLTRTEAPVFMFLFKDKPSYVDYLRTYFPSVPNRRALFIKGEGPGMVFAFQNEHFPVDVRHEGTHALIHAQLPTIPLWLDEGLAEYFEVPALERAYDNPHLSPTKWAARFRRCRKLEDLEGMREVSEMGPSEYRSAWAWVHFLLHSSADAREELIRYVHDLHEEQEPGKLSPRLRKRIPELDRKFSQHFRSWRAE